MTVKITPQQVDSALAKNDHRERLKAALEETLGCSVDQAVRKIDDASRAAAAKRANSQPTHNR